MATPERQKAPVEVSESDCRRAVLRDVAGHEGFVEEHRIKRETRNRCAHREDCALDRVRVGVDFAEPAGARGQKVASYNRQRGQRHAATTSGADGSADVFCGLPDVAKLERYGHARLRVGEEIRSLGAWWFDREGEGCEAHDHRLNELVFDAQLRAACDEVIAEQGGSVCHPRAPGSMPIRKGL